MNNNIKTSVQKINFELNFLWENKKSFTKCEAKDQIWGTKKAMLI